MRRLCVVAGMVLALTGCSNLGELFSAQADVAASARGQQLKAERLAEILSKAGGTRVDADLARFVSNLWIEYTLFAQEQATGKLQVDSALVAEAMWPTIVDRRIGAWRDTLLARRPAVDSSAVDVAYAGNDVRVFQHILISPKGPAVADTNAARRETEQLLSRMRGGVTFASQAERLNQDATKTDGGFLPPSGRGAFVPEFEGPAWNLAPGAISEVVQSPFGFHLIRRPPLGEVRVRLLDWATTRASQIQDSVYLTALAANHGLKVRDGAGTSIKQALDDVHANSKSSKVLVDLDSGPLTVGIFSRWMTALQPGQIAEMKQQPDTGLNELARLLAQQVLLQRQADSANVVLDVADWTALQLTVSAGTAQLITEMGLNAPEVADSTRPASERSAAAAVKVDEYFSKLVTGQAQLKQMPGVLGSVLRDRGTYRLNQAGVTRALELALAQARTDSATAAAQPVPPVVQPAPGGPPVPGGEGGN